MVASATKWAGLDRQSLSLSLSLRSKKAISFNDVVRQSGHGGSKVAGNGARAAAQGEKKKREAGGGGGMSKNGGPERLSGR